MEEIYPFNEYNKTIFYTTTFMIYTIITCYFMASLSVNSILIRDITILGKWFSDRKKKCKYLTFRRDHRMSYVHFPVENVDKKRLAKGEINIKDRACVCLHTK